MQWVIDSFADTDKLALEIKTRMMERQFIGLIGPMGAGKTYFVKALVKALGLNQEAKVNSPSFALHQRYENEAITFEHLDLYRLEGEEELESIGFWDLFSEDHVIIVVEWADRLNPLHIPKKFNPLFLKFEIKDNQRLVTLL